MKKTLLYQIIALTILRKTKKNHTTTINLKYHEFELLDGSYSISDIEEYFAYILKNIAKRLINPQ